MECEIAETPGFGEAHEPLASGQLWRIILVALRETRDALCIERESEQMPLNQAALAIFDHKQQADIAVRELNLAGFAPEQISVARQLTSEEVRESEIAPKQRDGAVAGIARFVSNLLGLGGEGDVEADFKAGRTIVRVHAGDRNAEAMEILLQFGGYNRVSQDSELRADRTL
jgi:hypothetical protein